MKNDSVPRETDTDNAESNNTKKDAAIPNKGSSKPNGANEDDGRKIGKNVREQKAVDEQVAAFEMDESKKSKSKNNTKSASDTSRAVAKDDNKKKSVQDAHDGKNGDKPRAKNDVKKKKKRNLWPLKAVIISFLLAFAVNAGSELVLKDSQLWLAVALTLVILALGVVFDMVGTAATSCDIQPFFSMAARKVKGAKTAVKLAKSSDVVSSVCCDIVGDICGIVSGVCAATIATKVILGNNADFWISVTIYAVISMATISLKAFGKGIAIDKANSIVFNVAKFLSIFSKEG